MKRNTLFSIFLVFAVVVSGAGTAVAASYGMNAQAENHSDTWIHEDRLTIESHDWTAMDWLEYEGDNGKVQTIDAHVNGTDGDAKVAYRADQLEADALGQFPRYSDEENNTDTWLNTSQWSSTSVSATMFSRTEYIHQDVLSGRYGGSAVSGYRDRVEGDQNCRRRGTRQQGMAREV
jgi:hypothetical protein